MDAFAHPGFDPSAQKSVHDIAIVQLSTRLPAALAIPLGAKDATTILRVDGPVEMVGYGATQLDGGLLAMKNAAEGKIVEVDADEMTIGRAGDVQNCFGDSGGPSYVTLGDGTLRIAGVVSRSADPTTPCMSGTIHTRVDANADWSDSTLEMIRRSGGAATTPGCSLAKAQRSAAAHPHPGWLYPVWIGVAFWRRRRDSAASPHRASSYVSSRKYRAPSATHLAGRRSSGPCAP